MLAGAAPFGVYTANGRFGGIIDGTTIAPASQAMAPRRSGRPPSGGRFGRPEMAASGPNER